MRRLVVITVLVGLAFVGFFAGGIVVAFETSFGRRIITSIIESELGDALGGDVHIGALEGRPPAHIFLRDIEIRDDQSVWLSADAITVDWRPVALFSGKISIDSVTIDGAHLWREPPKSRDEKPKPTVRGAIRLPEDLPNITIRRLILSNLQFSEAVAGRPIIIDGAGALRAGGRLMQLRFNASSAANSDFVDATIEFDPASDHGLVDVVVTSEPSGAIASLLDLGGSTSLDIKGDAPLSDFSARLIGELGAYGELEASLASNLLSAEKISIETTIVFGEKLTSVAAAIGPKLTAKGDIAQAPPEITVRLEDVRADAGEASGLIGWSNRDNRMERAHGALDIDFAQSALPQAQRYLGEHAFLDVEASLHNGAYDLKADILGQALTATLTDGRTDLRRTLSGHLVLSVARNEDFPAPFKEGAEAAGELNLDGDGSVAFRSIDLSLRDGSTLVGDAVYRGGSKSISFAGDASITPAFITNRLSSLKPSAPLIARIVGSGPVDNFTATIDAESSEVAMNGANIPAAELSARLAGLPNAISVALSAKSLNQPGELTLLFKQSDAGSFSLPRLRIETPSFQLSGNGAWNGMSETASIDVAYHGNENAHPYPGLKLAGAISAKGKVGRGVHASSLGVHAENVVSDDFAIAALDFNASGPPQRIAFEINTAGVDAPVAGVVERLEATGIADLSAAPVFRFDRLAGVRLGALYSITAPATLAFGDGVSVSNLRAQFGAEGSLRLDGRFSSERWLAAIAANNLPLAEANIVAAFDIELDTNKPSPAHGDFVLKPLFASDSSTEISGDVSWDGEKLRLVNRRKGEQLKFTIDVPIVLTRKPELSVATEGTLSGEAAYEGVLQSLTPYFPTFLQTLEGDVKTHARISGTLDRPVVDGEIVVNNGAYTELASGLTLTDFHMNAVAASADGETKIDIRAGARGAGQDVESIKFDGAIELGEESSIDATLALDDASFAAGPVNKAVASGEIRFTGPLASANAAGALDVRELNAEIISPPKGGLVDIDVIKKDDSGQRRDKPVAKPPLFTLDVRIAADDRIFIRGRGLESEWRADIRAAGEANDPVLVGDLTLRRGTLDFSGRRFTFKRGTIAFDRLTPNDPTLDLRAEYVTSDAVTAAIEVSGRASAPTVSLVSSPSLPSEDVMALVLFGKPARELSALESLQVAEALAQLSGVGPFGSGGGVTGIARRTLGLDLLNVSLDQDAGASSLEVGKYVSKGLFVSAKQDARGEKGSVRVEYEISNSISIETEMKQDGEQTVSANWKRDF